MSPTLSRTDVLALPAGRKLDSLIAEKVMGLAWVHTRHMAWLVPKEELPRWLGITNIKHTVGRGNNLQEYDLAAYSSDIAAAFQVVEKMLQDRHWNATDFQLRYGQYGERPAPSPPPAALAAEYGPHRLNAWCCDLGEMAPPPVGETAMLAICRASLLAVLKL